jgi:signal transduction histidine kinase
LQARGEQLGAIFALSPDGFVSFDGQRRANYVSPAFMRLTGIDEAQILGADEAALEAGLRQHAVGRAGWRGFEAMRRELREAKAAGRAPTRELISLSRPSQRILEAGLRSGSTPSISQVLSLRDVTHEPEVAAMKSEFVSTAAHELRTPMTSIFGFAELMMQRQLAPEKQQQLLAIIHRQSRLMISIIDEMLDLARIEARRGSDFELQTLDLGVLAAELVRDFKPPQERETPRLELAAGDWSAHVDRNKMAQALGNVLSNAYKYSPGGGPVKVRLLRGAGAELGLQVQDAGIGMTAEQLARVSERFYRADASGSIPGTGLGMSIVKEIVELQGGRLALASEPGRGSTVTLWMPATPPEIPHPPHPARPATLAPEPQVTS